MAFEPMNDAIIDFEFIDNFLIVMYFIMQPITRIQFPKSEEDPNIIRFIPNGENKRRC
jgi:hypothetical protein